MWTEEELNNETLEQEIERKDQLIKFLATGVILLSILCLTFIIFVAILIL